VLSDGLWRSRFGADPSVLGHDLVVNDEPFTIVGVLPPAFRLEAYSEIRFWIPQVEEAGTATEAEEVPLHTIARLAEGRSAEAAQAELDVISQRLPAPEDAEVAWTGEVVTPRERLDAKLRTGILVLQAAVALVLLIACANIAHLLLAQGEGRFKEFAVRSVLGACRGRLVRQLLTESLVLSLIGGTLGLLLALWGGEAIRALLPEELSRLEHVPLNGSHLGFTLLVALTTGVIFGLFPALQGSLPDLSGALKQSAASSGAPKRWRLLRQILVGAEVAISLVLLIGAGLLIKGFVQLQRIDPGFAAENLLTMRLELPEERYAEAGQQVAFFDELFDGFRDGSAPLQAVSLASGIVTDFGGIFARPEPEGRPDDTKPKELLLVVTAMPDYFRTLGLPLIRGRGFTDQDREGTESVVVVNEALARRYFSGEDPVGQRIRLGEDLYRIVGVAGDTRLPALVAWGHGDLQVYFPSRQSPTGAMTLAVRTTADQAAVVDLVKARIWAIDPHVPVTQVAMARDLLADSLAKQRFNAILMALFAGLAALLTAVGVYGVVASSVGRRTREIGIRLAVGAGAGNVLRQVIWQGMRPVAAGIVFGIAGALALVQLLAGLLPGTSVQDPAIFGAVSLLVATTALIATWLPAHRAVRVDPMTVLRQE
jgi:predicted permease